MGARRGDHRRPSSPRAFAPVRVDLVRRFRPPRGPRRHARGGESHFTVTIQAAAFAGLGRINASGWSTRVLAEELAGPVHALSITLGAGEELSGVSVQGLAKGGGEVVGPERFAEHRRPLVFVLRSPPSP